ncbi:MAG: hypothetical protein CL886_05730 [Dehalococcoidia bacterium]|nr:hypothetical protein [Dehalococcoidia bacterium]
MEFGMFMEFGTRHGASEQEAFTEGFSLVDAAECWGLDGAWLAELHFNPGRSVLSSPITIASSIATRTKSLKIGMAVYVLPLNNPIRIAEEVATIDQISEGRFELGIGRSGFPRAYDVYGIPYDQSRARFDEALEILIKCWSSSEFSYDGEFYKISNAHPTPQPYQKPHPPIRIAATTPETFIRLGEQGWPIFVGLRGMDISELSSNINAYRKAWSDSEHPGQGKVSLRIPVYAADTDADAADQAYDSISSYFGRMGTLYREAAGSSGIDATELRDNRADRLATMSYEEMLDTKVAFGSPGSLIEKFKHLEDILGVNGIVAELNPGGLIPSEKVLKSLKLITHNVMPNFK